MCNSSFLLPRYCTMCSDGVTSLPQFSFGSGLRSSPIFSVEIPEAQFANWLQLREAACGVTGFPVLPVNQILEVPHGKRRTSGQFPLQAENKHSFTLSDDQWHSLQLDASGFFGAKFAKRAIQGVHRYSEDIISTLPDELLCHIFHFLGTARDRLACASVSKRWLMLQSQMPRGSFVSEASCAENKSNIQCTEIYGSSDEDDTEETDAHQTRYGGHLSRYLSGHKASDVRLASIALGTEARGGLGKLCVRGGPSVTGLEAIVTNVGLSAIGAWCSGLRTLSLWNCPFVDNEALAAVGKGCQLLEKIDLYKCPLVGNSGLQVVAKSCPLISFLNLDECEKVGNDALVDFAEHCPNLTTLEVKNCLSINDFGIIKAVRSMKRLNKLKLAGLKVTDKSLTAIAIWAETLTRLTLQNLDLISADGFNSFGKSFGLQALKHLYIIKCKNFTDNALSMLGSHCQSIKHMSLQECEHVSDKGLGFYLKIASGLQVLQLEKCNLITGTGLVTALSGRGKDLKELIVKRCERLRHVQAILPHVPHGTALKTICVADCPGVDDVLVALVGLLCPEASSIDFSGLTKMTDDGLLAFLCGSRQLTTLKLSGCSNVTDRAISAIVSQCGQDLRTLALDGCKGFSNMGLKAVASHCPFLEDLDVAGCAISDAGMKLFVETGGLVLTSLNLSRCGNVTDRILPLIYENCNSLQDLNIKNCPGFSDMGIAYFQSQKWNCKVLH